MDEHNQSERTAAEKHPGAFLMMALRGDVTELNKLIKGGNDPNLRGPKGNTALMLAAGKDIRKLSVSLSVPARTLPRLTTMA